MNSRRIAALSCLLLCLFTGAAGTARAQEYTPTPVTVSKSKVRLGGKIYYSHVVLERQTIYGIAKAYGVTEDDLYQANPSLKEEGLRSGHIIMVPVVEQGAKPAVKETPQQTVKETPKPAVKETPKESDPDFVEHKVKWFEDIYDVAKAYGVTPQAIMDANGLKSSRISNRQVLRIPLKAGAVYEPVIPVLQEVVVEDPEPVTVEPIVPLKTETEEIPLAKPLEKPEETVAEDDESGFQLGGIFDWLSGKGQVDMALILPFNASGNPAATHMDFYSGVLMALRDLEAEGVKANLDVIDLQAGLPSAFELGKHDFILGPVSEKDLTGVLERTGGRTPVISPLDQRAAGLGDSYDGFIQAPSTVASQYTDLAAWAAEDARKNDKIILVTEKTASGSTVPAVGIREALLEAGTTFEGVTWTVSEGRSLPASLTGRLIKGGVNRIIVASEKETFVSDVVRNLGILMGKGYEIAMYAPSKVRTFETVDGSAYHQCQLHISSPYYADFESDKVQKFVRSYRALFRTEPSQFAFQGYDLAHFFAGLCSRYGSRWTKALDRVSASGLHTDFRFVRTGGDTFRNTGIRRIIYHPDYTTELVK